jgi:hypothetical protein
MRWLDKFHLNGPDLHAVTFTWFWWIVVYAGVPISMTIVLIRQCRGQVEDPPRLYPLPGWTPATFAVLDVAMLLVGVALFVLTQAMALYWPWSLTPPTGRAIPV